jgi:hypothetical protein
VCLKKRRDKEWKYKVMVGLEEGRDERQNKGRKHKGENKKKNLKTKKVIQV